LKASLDWHVRVTDEHGEIYCSMWFGYNPSGGDDGLIRFGTAERSTTPKIWKEFRRYSDGSYSETFSKKKELD
jgi:hypothetical protein